MTEPLGLAFAGQSPSTDRAVIARAQAIIAGEVASADLPIGERDDLAAYGDLHLAAWSDHVPGGVDAFPPISADDEGGFLRERLTLWEKVDSLVMDLDRWRAHRPGRAVVVAVAPANAGAEPFRSRREFEEALDDNAPSVTSAELYAYAALEAGLPYAALGGRAPAAEPAFADIAEAAGLPISVGARKLSDSNPAILASIVVETARCLDLAARRGLAGRIDAFDALFAPRPPVLAGSLGEQRGEDGTAAAPPSPASESLLPRRRPL